MAQTERVHFTLPRIDKLRPPVGAQARYVFDDDPRHLAVRITPAGAKSFVFASKLKGVPIRVTIGATETWLLDAARAEAKRLQVLVDQGIDPRQEKAERIAAAEAKRTAAQAARAEAEIRARYTLRALFDVYAVHLERSGKAKSAAATRSAFKCHVFPYADVADAPARDVTAHQVAALVRRVREAGKERAAGILRSYLSAAYNAAKRAPFDSALPVHLADFKVEHNPVDAIPAIPVQRGDRTLSVAELRAYIGHLFRMGQAETCGPDLPDLALLLALLSGGQRMAQLLRAKVGDFDPDSATLRLWDGKGKRIAPREHLLPLAPQAAAIVSRLVERARGSEAVRARAEGRAPDPAALWLFSTHGRVPMTETTPGKRAADISHSMGGEPFNLRDVRRTVETMLAGLGVSKDTRAQLLSHGISGVQAAHYDRHSYIDEKRAALVAWESRLATIQKGERDWANALQLHGA